MLNIDWANFTLLNSLMGGILIGIAATIIFFVNGRIMGISGILGNLITTKETDQKFWRIIFILGVLIGPLIFILLFKEIKSEMVANTTLLIISGFLVGLGTSLGNLYIWPWYLWIISFFYTLYCCNFSLCNFGYDYCLLNKW